MFSNLINNQMNQYEIKFFLHKALNQKLIYRLVFQHFKNFIYRPKLVLKSYYFDHYYNIFNIFFLTIF